MDKIKVYRKCGKRYDYKYRATCKSCGIDKGYCNLLCVDTLCKKCSGKINASKMTEETKKKMSLAKLGKPTWNKGLTGIYSEETKSKMKSGTGKTPHNKGVPMSIEQKIKLSCVNQNLNISDFKDFTTTENKRQRNKFNESELHNKCFEKANYTCDLYSIKGVELHAHHLESWHTNKELRFDPENLVCLSKDAHNAFHKKYGRKNNTKEQYEEFKKETLEKLKIKQDLYIVAGCPASGKSWVCSQLKHKFNYVSHDAINKDQCMQELIMNNNKPLLFDPTMRVSTFIKRLSHLFNIKLIIIIEEESVINQRIISRGGSITNTIRERIIKMSNLSKTSSFNGTSLEVLEYLKLL